jgi:DNA-binding CsgD family transcriptional regulator
MAIPFPAGASPIVAEEAGSIPHFTLREKQIGGWLAEGKTDPEITRILDLGIETVRTHIKNMRQKTEVENRNALFAWIWRNRYAAQFHQPTPRQPVKY